MNHNSFPTWVKDAIFYQIFPERFHNGSQENDPADTVPWGTTPTRDNFFGGDLAGIYQKLDYLEGLGINAIYLNPIFKAGTNHKYDTTDYYKVDPCFGTQDEFRNLVEEAHRRGMRIILDAVFNHCGVGFNPFFELQQNGSSSMYKNWFIVDSFPIEYSPPSYQTCGSTWYLPKLNLQNPEVEEYMLNIAQYWIKEFDIDGWRLDVPWKVHPYFWRKFRDKVKASKSDAYIVGEVWRWPDVWLDGKTCDGVINYPLRNYILDYCLWDHMDAEDFHYEINRLLEVQSKTAPYNLSVLGSHDTPRFRTLCDDNLQRYILGLVLQFTLPGAPMIYYGDEIGLLGENDPDCRRTMPWDQMEWHKPILDVYKKLIRARRSLPALRTGKFKKLKTFNAVYAYKRYTSDEEVIIILNPREELPQLSIPRGSQTTDVIWRDILSEQSVYQEDGVFNFAPLPAEQAFILVKDLKQQENKYII
jgi:glycosidase